jgi:S-adenosyl-L-methionine hydrolase (adenosine-forming)
VGISIALLTDFGTRDPYVAAMRGVISGRTSASLHDLSHEIAPFDVMEAAWFLRTVVPYWPEQTLFVCVVDPGVGTERRILAAEQGRRYFLAPDNGLLSLVLDARAESPRYVFSVEKSELFLPGGSNTFHGRDRFAPVAAAIANGLALEQLGPPVQSIVRLPYEPPHYEADVARGTVVSTDRFGNLITDIEVSRLRFSRFALHGRRVIIDRMERTYAGAEPGPFLIVGSSGCLEISVANGSAAERLQMSRLDRVEVWKIEA